MLLAKWQKNLSVIAYFTIKSNIDKQCEQITKTLQDKNIWSQLIAYNSTHSEIMRKYMYNNNMCDPHKCQELGLLCCITDGASTQLP